VSYGDRYVLQTSSGPAVVGVYGIAYQFAHLVFTWGASPHRQVWDPTRFEVVKRDDRDHVFSRAFVQHNLIQVVLGVAITLAIPEVLRVMTTPPFYPAARWVPILVLAFVMYSWTYFLNIGMYLKERPELITRNAWIGAAVAVAGYLSLIPPFGAMGAAVANLVSYMVLAWLTHRASQRLFPVRYEWQPIIRLFAAGAVICVIGHALPRMALAVAISAKALLFVVFLLACYHIGVLTSGERELARLLVRSPRRGLAILRGRTA
jgi:O-antigen/teichoic acid export membrane protein